MREYLQIAEKAALVGGNILRYYFEHLRDLDIREKSRNDYVTQADIESERAIRSIISSAFPDHKIVGEEEGISGEEKGRFVWYVDPLDGTKNFMRGLDVFGVSIALEVDGELVLGVVYSPVRDELYSALRGEGAYKNWKRISVSGKKELKGAFLATGFPHRSGDIVEVYIETFRTFSKDTIGIRRMGSAAMDLCMVAEGIFDAFWEYHLKPWDIAAGVVIVEEAGGVVTDFRGGRDFLRTGNILGAASPQLHREMLEVLKKYDR